MRFISRIEGLPDTLPEPPAEILVEFVELQETKNGTLVAVYRPVFPFE
jgi:hypothetical protein